MRTSYKNKNIVWKFKDNNKDIYWYLNDKLHRTDGPAIEREHGTNLWLINGLRHRLDGPAVEFANGGKIWYIDGNQFSYGKWLIKRKNYLK